MRINIRYIVAVATALVMVTGLDSCKKKEEPTKSYLGGYFRFDKLPTYVELDENIRFAPYGVTHPDGKRLGMYWSCSKITTKNDTLYYAVPVGDQKGPLPVDEKGKYPGVYKDFCFHQAGKDTLGTFTFNFVVYPEDTDKYYSSTATATIVTVDEELSVPEIRVMGQPAVRDSKGYGYNEAAIGSLTWLSRNWAEPSKGGLVFAESESMSYIAGRFYTFEQALSACPAGYRLPTAAEVDAMAAAYGNVGDLLLDAHFNSEKMWEFWPDVKITGKSGLNLLPWGYASASDRRFTGYGKYAALWTSDTEGERAVYKYIYCEENDLKTGYADKTNMAMPVRCVK